MDWHERYLQQASWTRDLRTYLLGKAGISDAHQLLEVGCGTGAILQDLAGATAGRLPSQISIYGLDIASSALQQSRRHVPGALLTRADALALPYRKGSFDITLCHFLLLWVKDPHRALLEMKRVTRPGGYVLALAEPDYAARIDLPPALSALGKLQTQSLKKQGAFPGIGSQLARIFRESDLQILETGEIEALPPGAYSDTAFAIEWDVLRHDLLGMLTTAELDRLMALDAEARREGIRTLHVPTYFAIARV